MADIDPRTAQRIFKEYSRGYDVHDISERHGVPVSRINRVVKFEAAVQSRVQEALEKKSRKMTKVTTRKAVKPTAKAAKGR